jgi:ABC-type nitrate/sulfonate/bicarbonate transport system substrate-binding protein
VKFLSARATAAVAAVLCGVAAAGCSSAGGSATTTGDVSSMPIIHGLETTNLVVSDFPAIDSGGLYIAQVDGLFAKEGLKVTIVPDFTSS